MAEIADIVVDCAHPASLARFWAQVLDGYAVAPYDEEELARAQHDDHRKNINQRELIPGRHLKEPTSERTRHS